MAESVCMHSPVAGYLLNSADNIRYFRVYASYPENYSSHRKSILFIQGKAAIMLTGRCPQVRFYILSRKEYVGVYWIRVQHPQQKHQKSVEYLKLYYKPTSPQLAKFVERCVYEISKHHSRFAQSFLPNVCWHIVMGYAQPLCICGKEKGEENKKN